MSDNFVKDWELDWVQQQIYDLQESVRQLQMENELLQNDLNTIKLEGCWRFVEDPQHTHRKNNE